MRQRSTWSPGSAKTAATSRKADIYEMNQEHPQPSPVEYESGNPDSWAETPTGNESVAQEYEGDHVKRNEIGMGEFRADTYKHKDSDVWGGKGKYDNQRSAAERKASAAERVARAVIRTSNDKEIENVAIELMALPDKNLISVLRALDKASPDSLPQEARFHRALACTKLAAFTLGDGADEKQVENLGRAFAAVDDVNLKNILRTVAASRVAQDSQEPQGEEEEEEEVKPAQQAQPEQVQQVQQGQQQQVQQVQQGQQEVTNQQQDQGEPAGEPGGELGPEELKMLDDMLHAEMSTPEQGGADVSAMFGDGAPKAASDISFDEGDEGDETAESKTSVASIDDLFADDPEVLAQRQIRAAELEQKAREGGFAVGRTASAGAKKLGAVKRDQTVSVDKTLENLWDRP